jgi:ribosomal protein S18 acetylase RimI-like enzyme
MTTTHDVRIRHATQADASALAEFGARTFEETFGPHNTPEDIALYLAKTYSPALQAREIADDRYTYYIADVDGAIAGFALLRTGPAPAFVATPRPLEVYRFYVDGAFQGAGVARTLMDRCIAEAVRRDATALWLAVWERNPRAIRFYEKCGFRGVAGSQVFMLGNDPQNDLVMVRATS